MPTVSSLPASLMRMALLPALILAATQAGAADSASTERLDSAIMSSHGALVDGPHAGQQPGRCRIGPGLARLDGQQLRQ